MLNEVKRFSLVKPTLQTPFHIDFEWWKQSDRSWRIYLRGYLSPEDQEFVLQFVKASGSLKQMAKLLDVSYPTVRNRLDDIIGKLEGIQSTKGSNDHER